jgi:hypothetical protein
MSKSVSIRLLAGLTVLLLAVGLLLMRATSVSSKPLAEQTGRELGASLGLDETGWPVPGGCEYYSEIEDGTGYCLDSVANSKLEAWALGRQLQAKSTTDIDRRIFEIEQEILEFGGNVEDNSDEATRLNSLVAELRALVAQVDDR